MNRIAKMLIDHATSVLAPLRPIQAQAMVAELAHIDSAREAQAFAWGCVLAAYRQRLSLAAAVAFGARGATALAAALFGVAHIVQPWPNLRLKLALLANPEFGACGARCEVWVRGVGAESLGHWLGHVLILVLFGALHIVAAQQLLAGDLRRLTRISFAIAGFSLALPLMGAALGWPLIYFVLIGMMAAMGVGLARLERWDFARR